MPALTFPSEVLDFVKAYDTYLLIGHQEPDGDCIGSQLGMAELLKGLGKQVKLYNQGPFKKLEINRYQPLFQERINPLDKTGKTAVVILDCSTLDRIGALAQDVSGLPLLVLDHHTAGETFGTYMFVQNKAPSTSFIVQGLFGALGLKLTKEAADPLMLGLCTDTGFFRHTETGAGDTFRAAGVLSDAGASVKATFGQVNGGKPLGNVRLMGLILSRAESYLGNKLLVSVEYLQDRAQYDAENRESDVIYQSLQSVKDNEVILLIREESKTNCTVGLRSKAIVDVGLVAQKFGGGGHIRAAGFAVELPLAELKKRLIEEISAQLK